MTTLLERIAHLASMEGITIGALEKTIGASKGVLSRAFQKGTDIQAKWLEKIVENYPQYSEISQALALVLVFILSLSEALG